MAKAVAAVAGNPESVGVATEPWPWVVPWVKRWKIAVTPLIRDYDDHRPQHETTGPHEPAATAPGPAAPARRAPSRRGHPVKIRIVGRPRGCRKLGVASSLLDA